MSRPSPDAIAPCTKAQDAGRSRWGCTECKRRRVKCDETFPVCVRCQKRGAVCQSAPRLRQWQIEAPWINSRKGSSTTALRARGGVSDDTALLQYWLERASQIMVIDPDDNPLSFPILEYIERCPSLKHALQSTSAAHKNYFDPEKLSTCLEERNWAIRLIIDELTCPGDNIFPVFLSVLLLGLSAAWTDGPTSKCGQEHLRGARALVDMLLSSSSAQENRPPYFGFMIGAYLYWEMATAFLVPTNRQIPINTHEIVSAVLEIGDQYHPIAGYSTEIFYYIGNLGRYCRSVIETGIRDDILEALLEEQMTKWEPNCDVPELKALSDAYRHHGLINIAAICYRRDTTIRNRALIIVRSLTAIPSSHASTNLQAIPLLTAGSELSAEDTHERESVQRRFKDLYSHNHLRGNLDALQLLDEVWALRDAGQMVNWLEVMLSKGWNMMLG
ncbi:fungal-specific transcription factor domain-containing protein [Ilyonectria sp. MPI-CAGE-AT-0026]|nr:fungal-specific transcription factor domain-containing protein [Ilyonectria sp. MPI-CAGE-AT-0026]